MISEIKKIATNYKYVIINAVNLNDQINKNRNRWNAEPIFIKANIVDNKPMKF